MLVDRALLTFLGTVYSRIATIFHEDLFGTTLGLPHRLCHMSLGCKVCWSNTEPGHLNRALYSMLNTHWNARIFRKPVKAWTTIGLRTLFLLHKVIDNSSAEVVLVSCISFTRLICVNFLTLYL
jgi:glucuronate isomerase